ncbi:saccharopine dehydrogenase NADP-binding domain-containing protein [Actinoplanes friuliensis]|uniref:Saccharopine dehydrogenase n=1 Tax=Actinoplanes friuliensis DSM 7358 TaxID=1246995 RepID=U5W3C8_9ACTN|nr:saccharopine dehydrogenase NADP-binding domain-containing protein [Actinoplanes friuliensis]AGZ43522.1 saccharopine dehydrogenase [Actinoplanes friuliensis DSM 7358]
MNKRIAVLGATGHTGGFVVAELRSRGVTSIPCGRGTDLDAAFRDADAVINCAGPFAATAEPVIRAAIRAGIAYLDVTAELEVVADTFATFAGTEIPIVPAVAFFGGLGDLLATSAMGDWKSADQVTIAYALSSWRPTPGTRATGRVSASRRNGRRIVFAAHELHEMTGDAPRSKWTFVEPVGTREVVGEFTTADSATIPSHLDVREITTVMSANAVDDLHGPDPQGPVAVDGLGRSAQTFLVEVVARSSTEERRAVASGHDIYAITAPLVVEAALRELAPGVACVGARFDAAAFLEELPLTPRP